jgi:hypothetical protein
VGSKSHDLFAWWIVFAYGLCRAQLSRLVLKRRALQQSDGLKELKLEWLARQLIS